MKDTLTYLIKGLLKENKIKVDTEELSFQIKSHPSYPSLHAVTGVLDHFKVNNLALEVPVNNETLEQLPQCFLAQIKTKEEGAVFALILKKGAQYKAVIDNKKTKILSLDDFLEQFTGIIVAVEADENTKKASTSI